MPREKIRSVKRPVAPRIVARVTWSLVAQLMASGHSALCQSTGTRELFGSIRGRGKGRVGEGGGEQAVCQCCVEVYLPEMLRPRECL